MPIDWREVPGRYIKDPRLGHRFGRNVPAGELTDPVWKLYSLGTDELGLIYNSSPIRDFQLSDSSFKRIFLFGGSTLAGLGVCPNNLTISSRLEMNLQGIDPNFRTVNCGVGAYSSWQQLVYLSLEMIQYSPDLIVIMDGWNDFVHSTWGNKNYQGKWIANTHRSLDDIVSLIQTSSGEISLFDYLHRRFYKLPVIRELILQGKYAYNAGVWSDSDYRTWNLKPWAVKTYATNVRSCIGLARSNGAKIVYLLQPQLLWGERTHTEHEAKMQEQIQSRMPPICEFAPSWFELASREFASIRSELHDAESIWIEDASAWLDNVKDTVYHDYNHYNELGQAIIAEKIAVIINKMTTNA